MKKLMLLGGMRYLLPVIEAAHKMGVYVITADYLPDNIAHKYSDEYCNVSIIEKEAVLKEAERLQIDGITSFACDPGVDTAAYVAEKLGLPQTGPYESVHILQNKGLFRAFLRDHDFNVPTAKSYHRIEDALEDVDLFHWPVIVKPTDSAGSKGVTRADDPTELKKSIEYALGYSHCEEFIVEDFLQQVGFASDTDCFTVDGKLKFVSYSCQHFDPKAENPYTPCGFSWPGSISAEHQTELTSELQRLLSLLHMKTSIYNVETRECIDGKAYIMECSPRGGGNRLAEMLRYATGVDMITNTVHAALGIPVEGIEQKPYEGSWAEIILHSTHPGTFDGLWISEDLKDKIIEKDLWIQNGMIIGGFKGANEAIGTLVLKLRNHAEVEKVLNHQEDYVRVLVR